MSNTLYTILFLSSMFFWFLVAFRQYKSDIFFYFLILALMDPIAYILSKEGLHILSPFKVYVFFDFIILLYFYFNFSKKKYFYITLFFSIIFTSISLFSDRNICYLINTCIHIFILFFFARRAVLFVAKQSKVNIFHAILILYETSIIMKFLTSLTNPNIDLGVLYYLITNIFQIFIAVFFIIYKEGDVKLQIVLKENTNQI